MLACCAGVRSQPCALQLCLLLRLCCPTALAMALTCTAWRRATSLLSVALTSPTQRAARRTRMVRCRMAVGLHGCPCGRMGAARPDRRGHASSWCLAPWRCLMHVLRPLLAARTAGDVLLHTVTDAILGALCLPDIGERARGGEPHRPQTPRAPCACGAMPWHLA